MARNRCAAALAAAVLSVVLPAASHAGSIDVSNLTVPEVVKGFADGTFNSVQLLGAFEARIKKFNPAYNAFISFNPDAAKEAAAADLKLKAGGPHSPLLGVPVVVKDSMDQAGIPTTNGYKGFSGKTGGIDLVPSTDADVVARLKAAGAVIIGKTNLPAFAADGTRSKTSLIGPTYNAYNRGFVPGASSSGTATSVAAGFAVLGLAEETGGSIQNPAGAQSLVGIKPTFGLVPTDGIAPLAGSTRDVAGPIAKTVYDAAITLDTLAGFSPADPKTAASNGHIPAGGYESGLKTTDLSGARLGLFGTGFKDVQLTPETQTIYGAAVKAVTADGATVVSDPFAGSGFTSIKQDSGIESLVFDYNKYLERLGPTSPIHSLKDLKNAGQDIFGKGGPLAGIGTLVPNLPDALAHPDTPTDLTAFNASKTALLNKFNEVLDKNHLDGLVFPQTFAPIPLENSNVGYPNTTVSEINILGLPGITVPAGYYPNGAPFDLIFVGKQFAEAKLLGYAYAYEQSTHLRVPPTLVPLPPAALSGLTGLAAVVVLNVKRRRVA